MSNAADFRGLRVALVGPVPPPAGGMANQTRQLAELLRREGAVVTLVATNAPYRPAAIAKVPGVRALFRLAPYVAALWRTAGQSDVMHVMANSGWSWHLFAAPAIWIASLRGLPVLVNYRGGEAALFLARSASVVRWSMQRADRLAVPSGFLEQIFARHRMPADILPNVVDLERFRPRAPRQAASAHLVVARNLEPLYGNDTAIRAFSAVLAQVPGAQLTIAGSGPDEVRLRALCDELGIAAHVRFTGRLDRDAMAALYREADLVLNPSHADNMPNSLLEAMASGVPVVSTNVGGVPFLVSDGDTALLVPPGDAPAMAAAALRVLTDASLWQHLASNGRAEVRRYTWSQVAPALATMYRGAIAN